MPTPGQLLDTARQLHQDGNWEAADALYAQLLDANPGLIAAQHLRGILRLQQGRAREALDLLQPLTGVVEQPAELWNLLGMAHRGLGDFATAATAFQRAITADPQHAAAHLNWGAILESQRQYFAAEKIYQRYRQLQPHDLAGANGLLRALQTQQKWTEQRQLCEELLTAHAGGLLTAENPMRLQEQLLTYRGQAHLQLQCFLEAIADFQRCCELDPTSAAVWNNLSYACELAGDLTRAEEAARQAVQLQPDLPEAHNTLGIALRSQSRMPEACDEFRTALQIRSEYPLAEFNLGTTDLALGDWPSGWKHYRARLKLLPPTAIRYQNPISTAEDIAGREVLVYPEQGYGDTLQFVRLLPGLKKLGAKSVRLACEPPLLRLLQGVAGADLVIAEAAAVESDPVVCPIGTLPELLQLTLETLPSQPYLSSETGLREQWRARLRTLAPDGKRIGIVWRGNRLQDRDALRSCALRNWQAWSQIPGWNWFSLQIEVEPRSEITEVSADWPVIDLGREITDFADTAAILTELDLVITVDTAVAHLAGALGLSAWVLLSRAADWRWGGADSTTTPWYPTLRLWKPSSGTGWPEVIACVGEELARMEAST